MRWFMEGLRALGWPVGSGECVDRSAEWESPNAPESGARGRANNGGSTLAARAQRLAELQEELHQLERLPSMPVGTLDGGGFMAPAMPPVWHDRMLELECEIEQLREEMLAEEAEQRSSHPRASEEVGQRILDQIERCDVAEDEERELLYG